MGSRHLRMRTRLQRLETLRGPVNLFPEIAPEWRRAAALSPQAYEHALRLTELTRQKWPDRTPSISECFEDPDCYMHVLVLEVSKAGSLDKWLAPVLAKRNEQSEWTEKEI